MKQEAFAQAYVKLGNKTEAYRASYDASSMKPATVNRKAKEVADNGKVTARVAELQGELAKESLWTRERAANILISIAENGVAKDPDKINSVKVLNTMHGFDQPHDGGAGDLVTALANLVDRLPN